MIADLRPGKAAFCGCDFALELPSSRTGFIDQTLPAGWSDSQVSSGAEIRRHCRADAIAGLGRALIGNFA
jgi:hypothetical protein